MEKYELKFREVKELLEKYPDKYVSIKKIADKVGINWRTAQKYVRRLRK